MRAYLPLLSLLVRFLVVLLFGLIAFGLIPFLLFCVSPY